MADMLPYCDFSEQETSGALRADLVVRLPGGQRIVVDAKAPLEAYRAASEATDEAIRDRPAGGARRRKFAATSMPSGPKITGSNSSRRPSSWCLFLPGDHFLTAALQPTPRSWTAP